MVTFEFNSENFDIMCEEKNIDSLNRKISSEIIKKLIASVLKMSRGGRNIFTCKYADLHTPNAGEPRASDKGPVGTCSSFVFMEGRIGKARLRVPRNFNATNGTNINAWWFVDPVNSNESNWGQLILNGIINEHELSNFYSRLRENYELDSEDNQTDTVIEKKNMPTHLNVIKYGPPGTGKTFSLVKDVLDITKFNLPSDSNIHAIIHHTKHENNFKQVEFVTFHQSYSYEEFVEGIRAEVINSQVTYKVHNGIFKRLCRRAYFHKVKSLVNSEEKERFSENALAIYESFPFKLLREHDAELANLLLAYETKGATEGMLKNIPKFVLCIDEINRANISRVFGELITLIEDTKRQGAKETISVTLPYSGDEFFVPDNLYILGTMNTSDRSLAKLDLALRRRFHFEDYYPDLSKVKNATAKAILEKLNEFISKELDREHTIGHSYLMTIDEDAAGDALNEALANAFAGKIIPLLEEYFLHEPTKVKDAITAAGISIYVANI